MKTNFVLILILASAPSCTDAPTVPDSPTGTDSTGSTTSLDPTATGPTTTSEPTTGHTTGTTSTSEAATSSTTTPEGTACGDGIVAGPEECDLGAANSNTGACTLECKHAVCGDGLVWDGVEACDFGLGNDDDYNGCRPTDCQLGPHCGDGVIDPEHEACDRGDLNGTGVTTDEFGPCNQSCGFHGRIFFLTSEMFDGNLGGVSGGDLKCRNAALAAGLPNATEYRAWLSDESMAPVNRFSQWNAAKIPIILVGGLVVADDFDELTDFGPRTGVARTEVGSSVFNAQVWTNTSAFGEVFSATNHCAGWTSASNVPLARTGLNALPIEAGPDWETWRDERLWTTFQSTKCNLLAHLYCIDDGVILPEED